MKYFIAIVLIAAVASARHLIQPADLVGLSESELAEVQQILDAIYSPSTDPTTAAMLEQLLSDLLGITPVKPPVNIPAIIDEFEPIHIGPALVDEVQPIDISPELVDFPVSEVDATIPAAPAAPAASSPLVQIIVNVSGGSSPVVVEQPEVAPTPVEVVDQEAVEPTPVEVAEEAEAKPEPVIIAPIIVDPVIVGPDTLN